jgi:alpha-ketoglutarate-dependent taurine dioxygenase
MTQARPFAIEPLPATFGAVVTGLRLAALDEPTFAALHAAWLEYALLIFPGQHLTTAEQVAFAKRIGPTEFDLAPISNVRADGSLRRDDDSDDVVKILKGNMGWHQDSTYMPVQAKGAVFTCQVAPRAGGETGFADMRAAYDALPEAMRQRIEGLCAHHSLAYSQGKLGHAHTKGSAYSGYGFDVAEPPLRPLVKVHPETGRRSLAIGRHAYGVPGLSAEESERLLQELVDFACQPPRVWHHSWTAGDAILWDNRALLHRAMPWDMAEPRVMYHSRLAGDPASEGVQPAGAA